MFSTFSNTIQGVVNLTWPMLLISVVILVSFRICYIIKKGDQFTFYKELLMLSFIIYILCLFQVVTFTDDVLTYKVNYQLVPDYGNSDDEFVNVGNSHYQAYLTVNGNWLCTLSPYIEGNTLNWSFDVPSDYVFNNHIHMVECTEDSHILSY